MKSKFGQDSNSEKLLAQWLDKYFYNRILDDDYGMKTRFKIIRPTDYGEERAREAQKQGVDALYQMTDGNSLIVDEKAQLNYMNNPLETFAFEVTYKRQNNRNVITQGWFINEGLKTTHYLLIYPHSDQVDKHYRIKSYEQFSKAELVLVEKSKLKEKLKSMGINKARIYEKVLEVADSDKRKLTFGELNDAYMVKTDSLAEKPINIVVRKHILNEIAEARWIVTRNGIEEI